jgi:hypothetical protein
MIFENEACMNTRTFNLSLKTSSLRSLLLVGVVGLLSSAAFAAQAVNGSPRQAHGHPYTLWDSQDVAAYKSAIAKDPGLKTAFAELRAAGDKRVAEPIDVPAHTLEADGNWTFASYKRGYPDAAGNWQWEWEFNGNIQKRAEDISNLGMLFALTGEEQYATKARDLLLAVADAYGYGKGKALDKYGHDHFEAYGFDGGDAGMFLAKACMGYDLIVNAPSVAKDRARIESTLLRPMAEHLEKTTFMYTTHDRWGMVCLYGVFIAGEILNDASMVNVALFGRGGTKDKLTGGFMDCFKPDVLREGTVWGAGNQKIDDQMAALSVLIAVAEVLWHQNTDLYSYHGAVLKHAFDAGVGPLTGMDAAALQSVPGVSAYRYAFRRYQDARYAALIARLTPSFSLAIGERLPTPPDSVK